MTRLLLFVIVGLDPTIQEISDSLRETTRNIEMSEKGTNSAVYEGEIGDGTDRSAVLGEHGGGVAKTVLVDVASN